MNKIFIENFKTALGNFEIKILSSLKNMDKIEIGTLSSEVNHIKTDSYHITIAKQNLNLRLSNDSYVATRIAWCFYIVKYNSKHEKLQIRFELNSNDPNLKCGQNSGEALDSIEYNNNLHQIHLGTEDYVLQWQRSINSDWLPSRYSKFLNFETKNRAFKIGSFTKYLQYGFLTKIPYLRMRERAYFHFILAEKPYEDHNVDTWLAVDISKKELLVNYPNLIYKINLMDK